MQHQGALDYYQKDSVWWTASLPRRFWRLASQDGTGLLMDLATQVPGYGWAAMFRKFLVDPVEMWWPFNVDQHRAFHEKEGMSNGTTTIRFFLQELVASFLYYALPGYHFTVLTFFSWVCWVLLHSVTAQQVGSAYHGLWVGALSFDWVGISAYHGSLLVTPWTSIVNVVIGFILFIDVIAPRYWKFNLFDARTEPDHCPQASCLTEPVVKECTVFT